MKKYIKETAGVSFIKIMSSVTSIMGLAAIPYITKSMIDNTLHHFVSKKRKDIDEDRQSMIEYYSMPHNEVLSSVNQTP